MRSYGPELDLVLMHEQRRAGDRQQHILDRELVVMLLGVEQASEARDEQAVGRRCFGAPVLAEAIRQLGERAVRCFTVRNQTRLAPLGRSAVARVLDAVAPAREPHRSRTATKLARDRRVAARLGVPAREPVAIVQRRRMRERHGCTVSETLDVNLRVEGS